MDQWAAWGPTIVSIITAVFMAGMLYANQQNQTKRLSEHDEKLEKHSTEIAAHDVEIAKLKAWQEGYAAARTLYNGAD